MSGPNYIYPDWIAAKLDLVESLALSEPQKKILNEWFKKNIFEIGVEHRFSREMREHMKGDEFKSVALEAMLNNLVRLIYKNGCYTQRQIENQNLDTISQIRILVCASPALVGKDIRSDIPTMDEEYRDE